jgi:hypothetical protein
MTVDLILSKLYVNVLYLISFFSEFSISEYKTELNVSSLEVHQVSELLEKLGIAEFMNSNPCDRSSAKYSSSHEWVNGK